MQQCPGEKGVGGGSNYHTSCRSKGQTRGKFYVIIAVLQLHIVSVSKLQSDSIEVLLWLLSCKPYNSDSLIFAF